MKQGDKLMEAKKPAKKKDSANPLEFSGRLESISVNSGSKFQFDLANKTGGNSYLLDSANQAHFATLAALVTSAYMAGKKIHVRATSNAEGLPFASEIRIGAKPKAPKVKKAKPAVRVKGPLVDVPPAA
jgi:hypothetical protein